MMKLLTMFHTCERAAVVEGSTTTTTLCLVVVEHDNKRQLGFGYALPTHNGKIWIEDLVSPVRLLRALLLLNQLEMLSPPVLEACWLAAGDEPLSPETVGVIAEHFASPDWTAEQIRGLLHPYRPDEDGLDELIDIATRYGLSIDQADLGGYVSRGTGSSRYPIDQTR